MAGYEINFLFEQETSTKSKELKTGEPQVTLEVDIMIHFCNQDNTWTGEKECINESGQPI